MNIVSELLKPILQFLNCPTPRSWLDKATSHQHLLLIDHANCELKAAQTAVWLLRRYAADEDGQQALLTWMDPYEAVAYRQADPSILLGKAKNEMVGKVNVRPDVPYGQELIDKMVRLIREELHHFEQVLTIMHTRGIGYDLVPAGRYARQLIRQVRTYEPAALVDRLIIGAFIEARSCERFAALAPLLDEELQRFYSSLLRSEARHYQDYLALAQQISDTPIAPRVADIGAAEAALITSEDEQFRFHSGAPAA